MHTIVCNHGSSPVVIARVLDRNSVAYSPNCRKGRNNLPHTVAPATAAA